MEETKDIESTPTKNDTKVERKSDCEVVVTRTVNAPGIRSLDESGPIQEMVGAEVLWAEPGWVRNGYSGWGAVPFDLSP